MTEINKCRTYVIGEFAKLSSNTRTPIGEFSTGLMEVVCKSRNQEDNMTVFVDYMDKTVGATGNTVHWAKVSDASRPLVCNFPGNPKPCLFLQY
jgi:hypothetical protein